VRLPKARAWVPERAAASIRGEQALATCVTVNSVNSCRSTVMKPACTAANPIMANDDQRIAARAPCRAGDLSLVAPGSVPACDFSARSSISPVIGNRLSNDRSVLKQLRTSGGASPIPCATSPEEMNCQSPFPRCAKAPACLPALVVEVTTDYRGRAWGLSWKTFAMLAIRPIQRHVRSLGMVVRRRNAAGSSRRRLPGSDGRVNAIGDLVQSFRSKAKTCPTKLGSERKTATIHKTDPMPLTGPKAAKIRSFIVERSGRYSESLPTLSAIPDDPVRPESPKSQTLEVVHARAAEGRPRQFS